VCQVYYCSHGSDARGMRVTDNITQTSISLYGDFAGAMTAAAAADMAVVH